MKNYIMIVSFALVLVASSMCSRMRTSGIEHVVNTDSSQESNELVNKNNNSNKSEENYETKITSTSEAIICNNQSIYNYYSVKRDNKYNYTLHLYDSQGNVVYEVTYNKEPYIEFIGDTIIKIIVSVGSPLNYTQFYDISTGHISRSYDNALLIENQKIIYMKRKNNNKVVLVISDLFNKDTFYKEIKREFSPTAVPSSAIRDVKFIDENKLQVKYLKGKDYIQKTEIIDLTDRK